MRVVNYIPQFADHVDLSVRKRKAPDNDDLVLQTAAKRTKDNAVLVQEL